MRSPSLAVARDRRYRGFMVFRVTSIRAAHLVLWSSPILLLILALTVTTPRTTVLASSPTTTQHPQRETLRSAPRARPTPVILSPTTSVIHSSKTTPTVTASTVPSPSTTRLASPSATSIDATGPSPASPPIVDAVSGAIVGTLDSVDQVEDVPLQGPGTWVVQSSAPMSETLTCSGTDRLVALTVNIDSLETCRLRLTNASTSRVRWQIVPVP